MTAYLDTNVLIRLFTGDPPAQSRKAIALLDSDETFVLTDMIAAECVFVLGSVYKVEPERIAELMRTVLGLPGVDAPGEEQLLRAFDLFAAGHDFADSYLVACAERDGSSVASLDTGIDKIGTVTRITGI